MVMFMMVIGLMMKKKDMVYINSKMEIYMKVNFRKVKNKDKENIILLMEQK